MAKQASKGETRGKSDDATQADIKRLTGVIEELSKKAPIQVAPYVKKGAPVMATAAVYFIMSLPYLAKAFHMVQRFVASLPEKVIYASLGFAVCFFGGIFPATIAAVEAWRVCGGKEAVVCLKMLRAEWVKVQAANKEDEKDTSSAKQETPQELIVRKAQVVLKAVEPDAVSHGIVGLYTGWIGVLAILKIEFARTVTLGERIGEEIYSYVQKYEGVVTELVPVEYRKWVPVGLRCAVKGAAISFAWLIQRCVSAVHSSIRGGRIFGQYLVDFLHEKKLVNFKSDEVYIDELIGWAIAAAGLIFQVSLGFGLPFPLNLLLLPVQLLEAFIRWSVSMA